MSSGCNELWHKLSFLILFLITANCHAQIVQPVPSDEQIKAYAQAAKNTSFAVIRKAEPFLTLEQREQLSKITIHVETSNWEPRDIRVGTHNGKPAIFIPIGFIYAVDWLDSATAAAGSAGLDQDVLNSYTSLFIRRIHENVWRATKRMDALPLPVFPLFARIPPSTWSQIVTSREYSSFKDQIKLASYGFIILHELAHYLVAGAEMAARVETREPIADEFAVSTAIRADLSPLLAFPTFMFFTGIEGEEFLHHNQTGYDAALCRGLKAILSGVDHALQDSEFVAFAESQGKLEMYLSLPERVDAILMEDNVTCKGLSTQQTLGRKIQQ